MPTRIQLPPSLVDDARAFSDGTKEPAEPRNAATVVLTRRGSGGLEVYLLRREASMQFAGGMCVFPGGGVDPRDFDAGIAWAGPAPEEWAERLGTDAATARALVCAAVRETFEESGVLLAGESATSVVADTTGEDWEVDRKALEGRDLALTEFLTRRGLVLRSDLLGGWAGWLTPVFEPRRYRTWFFVAELPDGQVTRDVSSESSSVVWMPVEEAVRGVERDEVMMLPPTYCTCVEVLPYDDPEALVEAAHERRVEMFMPAVDAEGFLSIPERMGPLLDARPEPGA